MIGSNGQTDSMAFAKQAAMAVIENLPRDASLDEIIDVLWLWAATEPDGPAACRLSADRIMATNPADLVNADRAARDADVLGMSRQLALDIVDALPARSSLTDILYSIATWHEMSTSV